MAAQAPGSSVRESELFHQYSLDFRTACSSIRGKASSLPGLSGDARRFRATDIEADISKADVLVRNLEMEARSEPGASQLLATVEEFKAQLRELKDEVKKALLIAPGASLAAARNELGLGEGASTSDVQRQRLATSTQQLQQSSQKLREARATLSESEASGASILEALQQQRGTLERSKHTLDEVNGSLDSAGGTLKSMLRRARWFW